jgi:hypothetical protein
MQEFDNLGKKLTDILYTAARKSSEVIENAKIAYNISAEKEKVTRLQAKIGAKVWQAYKDGGAAPGYVMEEIDQISTLQDNIRDLEKSMEEAKAFKTCVECGAKLNLSDVFCPHCGKKQGGAGDGGAKASGGAGEGGDGEGGGAAGDATAGSGDGEGGGGEGASPGEGGGA